MIGGDASFALTVLALAGLAAPSPAREISLDGFWEFRRDGSPEWKEVQVPSSFEEHEGMDFDGVGWYRKRVSGLEVPGGFRALLHFEAAATHAEVFWNGRRLGEHLGGWTPFRFDVTKDARAPEPAGGHEIVVRLDERVGHNTQGFLPVLAPHFGGIWQSVKILVRRDPTIDDLRLLAIGNPDAGRIEVEVPLVGGGSAREPVARCRLRGSESWSPEVRIEAGGIPIPRPKLWSPAEPNLYELEIRIEGGDAVSAVAAFRKVETKLDALLLNSKPLIVRGVLNWGLYPPLHYPKPDEARFRRDLELVRSWGFNLVKFCLWVPPRRYLEIADEVGMLTWMEYPTWHPQLTKEHLEDLRREFAEFFALDRNHPSVILRSLTCETGASADLAVIQELYAMAHRSIPGALVEDDSSWIGWNRVMDFYDDHPYGNNHTWVPTLRGLKDTIARKGRTLPLLLGESMSADTWVPIEPLLEKVRGERPFWLPRFFDGSARWTERMRAVYGPGGLDRLVSDSLRYAHLMRKYQAEAYRREVPAGGYVMSVMRDAPVAAMGFLDYHDRPKWAPAHWLWQGDTCLLLATKEDRRSFASRERLDADLLVSHFGPERLEGFLRLDLRREDADRPVWRAGRDLRGARALEPGKLAKVFELDALLPVAERPERFVLTATLETPREEFRNEWPLWVVPSAPEMQRGVLEARAFGEAVAEALERGDAVFLEPAAAPSAGGGPTGADAEPPASEKDLPLAAHWFLRGGVYMPDHPIFERVPRELFVDLQHFDLASDVIPEVGYLEEIDPALLLWDTHDRTEVGTHALLYEARVARGRLLVCALRLGGETNAAGRWLRSVLLEHLASGPEPRRGFSEKTWARIRARLREEKIDLTGKTWKFRPDPREEGLREGWHLLEHRLDEAWRDLRIGLAWEAQGYSDLDGWAWYRLAVEIPASWAGREFYLSFEGVDDSYELYVDGKLAGRGGDLATRKDAFSERKSHRISELAPPGRSSAIAVRVCDWGGAGGIHRPVVLSTVPLADGPEVLAP